MKLSNTIITAIFTLLTGTAVAKNVFNPRFTDNDIKNAALELEQQEFMIGKREAKNTVDLNLKISEDDWDIQKRESKNTFDAKLIVDESGIFKRDGKNTFDVKLTIDDAFLEKRDGKNVFGINFVVPDDLEKREASPKNVVDVHLIIDDNINDNQLVKRTNDNVIDIGIRTDNHEFVNKLQNPMSLGFLVGAHEFTAEKVVKDGEKVNVHLRKDSKGCHGKKNKLDLKSLTEVLETFETKMADPTIDSKDNVPIVNSEAINNAIMVPAEGDIATAFAQREDLGLFFRYLRESPELFKKCETGSNVASSSENKKQVLIFAPTNDALINLNKKPWQFPKDINSAKTENEKDLIIQRNILNFVESHFVETEHFNTASISNGVEFTSMNGRKIILENSGSNFKLKQVTSDEWIVVSDIEVFSNGAILTINKALV
ncbi:hypothetical protein CANINC_002776 [Pichia inconspicua]|uniref:FAS1 domain-containing protein n=1 Tax=Pichia inconspicua TaxID=52247 RepID=A0A4T0X096_9ASCO|nr:hypothetical protein CANINC_002776 [[Candida] inconspicua]